MTRLFRQSFFYLLSVHVLALAVFSVFRLVQFITLHGMIADASATPLWAFTRGIWFDNVIACYVSVLPLAVLLVAASFGWSRRWLVRSIQVWYSVMFAVAFIPSAANTPYFQYFFKVINSSIFGWFGYVGTTSGMLLQERSYWLHFGLYFVVVGGFVWLTALLTRRYLTALSAKRPVTQKEEKPNDWKRKAVPVAVNLCLTAALIGLCLFGIRGRRGYNPIKISQAYYCNDSFLNQLGINPAFNLLTSVMDDMRKENQELHLMPYPEAVKAARLSLGIEGKADSSHVLRRTVVCADRAEGMRKKNVVIILMESMSASLLGTFGQQQPLTPTLDSLYHTSLAFTHCYSAGIHTNHGLTATLYSFPALMFRNLMKGTVTPQRQGLPTVLKADGYENMFFMTHEAQYDNMKAFFSTNGYDRIFSQENYPKSEVVNSFGVSDHYVLDYALNAINRQQATSGKPFLATVLTISNHPPFIVPSWFKPKTKEKDTQIVEYADWAIGDFLRKARHEKWYDNTVFVLLADHGKIVGNTKSDGELPQSYNHIPLLIFGGGIKAQTYEGLAMQVDVMPTLLGILGMSYTYDGFGLDLLKEQRSMVFYSADNQLVARDMHRCYIYNPTLGRSFCYDVDQQGTLTETKDANRFNDLRHYVFSMIQTAEFIQQHNRQLTR